MRFYVVSVFFLHMCVAGAAMALSEGGNPKKMVGGPCSYMNHPGTATIVSVQEASPSSGYSKEKFEVKFTFKPDEEIKEPFLKIEGRTFLFTLQGGQYPEQKDLDKYGIKPGADIKGLMRSISSGTCTPILFDFNAMPNDGK